MAFCLAPRNRSLRSSPISLAHPDTHTHTRPSHSCLRRSTSIAHGPPSPVLTPQEARKPLVDRLRVLAPRAVFVPQPVSSCRIAHLSYSFQDVKDRRPSVLTAPEPPSRHRQRSRRSLRSSSDLEEEGIVMFVVRLTRVCARAPLSPLARLSYLSRLGLRVPSFRPPMPPNSYPTYWVATVSHVYKLPLWTQKPYRRHSKDIVAILPRIAAEDGIVSRLSRFAHPHSFLPSPVRDRTGRRRRERSGFGSSALSSL
ncbi:hypothetical protein EDB86DRAFT_3088580 [Lactarius hatsudake]|nr:hypothetical protein EDB86DRAFT_3088580 [Lactarius hatsudake]